MIWFSGKPIAVQVRPGLIKHVNSVESAAEVIADWPSTKKRDKAAAAIVAAYDGEGTPEAAKRAFEAAAKEIGKWVPYRGP